MQALLVGQHAIEWWVKTLFDSCFKRAKKERKILKNKCPKPTAWDIIKSLA
jgi:hypothetical protein